MAYKPAAARPTARLNLISSPDHYIDYYTSLNWADRKALRAVALNAQDPEADYFSVASDVAVTRLVADWNLDDAAGEKLPLTQENFDNLDDRDMDALLAVLSAVVNPQGAAAEDKKKGPESSGVKPSAQSTAVDQPPSNS